MENFEENVYSFLKHKEKKVLVIKGDWGIGKTYQWNQIVERRATHLDFSSYSYVSLFGLESLIKLQSSVFYNSKPMDSIIKPHSIKQNLKKVSHIAKQTPHVAKFIEGFNFLENSLVNNYLICMDDLERRSRKFSLSALLGYVSQLSESNDCKVVLIFNEDTFDDDDKKVIDLYREKVIDLELEFSPSVISNIDIEFSDHPYRDFIYNKFKNQGLKNIRILKHIKWNLDYFMRFFEQAEDVITTELIDSISVLTYIHHDPSIKIRAKNIKELYRYKLESSAEEEKLQGHLASLGYNYFADYENEIINYIEDGWMDEGVFSKSIAELNDRQRKTNISSELSNVWGLYNNNFIADINQLIEGLEGFLNNYLEHLSLAELLAILEVLSDLKEGFDSQDWKSKYADLKSDSTDLGLLRELKTFTKDEGVINKIKSTEKALNEHDSIYTVLSKIASNRAWNEQDEEYLASYTLEEIYEFLISNDKKDLLQILREVIRFYKPIDGGFPKAVFGRNLHGALIKVSSRSELDKYRVKRFFNLNLDQE